MRSADDDFKLQVTADYLDTLLYLFRNHSHLRFCYPFYYGNYGEMIWIVMFDFAIAGSLLSFPIR